MGIFWLRGIMVVGMNTSSIPIWELLWGYEKGTSGPRLCRRDSWEKKHGDNRENHRPPSVMS